MVRRDQEAAGELYTTKLPHLGRKQVVYKNKYQKIYKVKAQFGTYGKEYFVTEAGERAGIVVVRGESVLLVRQYRFIIDGLSYEIPGGRVDDGETPEAAAVRECMEETGVRCIHPRLLVFYHVGLDSMHCPTYLFYTDKIVEECEIQSIHKQEVNGLEWVPLPRCIEMICQKQIVDAFSIVGLLAFKTLRTRL